MAKKKSSNPIEPKDAAVVKPQVVALAGTEPTVAEAEGLAARLGKGLWGIVGNKTRYSTITQFGGIEYVRYEYRRIPEGFRAEAVNSTFLDVIEVSSEAETVSGSDVEALEADGEISNLENKAEDADVPADDIAKG
jgi:hypothetical protein